MFISSDITACSIPMFYLEKEFCLLGKIQCLIEEKRLKHSSKISQPRSMFLTALQISSFPDELPHRKSTCSNWSQSNILGKHGLHNCLPVCLASFPFHTDHDFFLLAIHGFTRPKSFYPVTARDKCLSKHNHRHMLGFISYFWIGSCPTQESHFQPSLH